MRRIAITALAAVTALGAASVAVGHATKTTKVKAALNVGQETPKPKGTKIGASGLFTGTLDGTTLKWRLTFKQLSGPATAAHIHQAPKGKPGPVIVPLCGPCTSPVTGTATLTAAQVKTLKKAGLYVNVHTTKNPGGEIRGQITIPRR